MNSRRGSTRSPIRRGNMSSAPSPWLTFTCSRGRAAPSPGGGGGAAAGGGGAAPGRQPRQRRLLDGEGRRAGRQPLDVGLGPARGLHQGQEVGGGDPLAAGEVQRRAVDALVDQVDL